MIKVSLVQVQGYTHRIVITVTCALILGGGFELVDAVGIVVLGHFSIDGQLKKEHFTEKHHNIIVVDNKRELMGKIIELLSFTGQTVLDIITCTDDHHCSTYDNAYDKCHDTYIIFQEFLRVYTIRNTYSRKSNP